MGYWLVLFLYIAMEFTNQDIIIQRKILLSVHKWCTIDEAREKEEKIIWCVRIWKLGIWTYRWPWFWRWNWYNKDYSCSTHCKDEIVWLPPTLDRVLYVLEQNEERSFFYSNWSIMKHDAYEWDIVLCDWVLLKDWVSQTLRDQSQETKDKIDEFLC
jgi:hypothetical protein